MIQMQTVCQVADNSGARKAQVIRPLKGSGCRVACIGDTVVVSIKDAVPGGKVKKGDVHPALVVRVAKEYQRSNGASIRFGSNAVVLINKQGEPLGTRVFGPVAREVRARSVKITSMAQEVW